MKRIIYVLPYLSRVDPEEQRHGRIFRERSIVGHTRQLGYGCELFMQSYARSVRRIDDEIGTYLFPVDDPENSNSKTHVSTALLSQLEAERPDLVVFKGMGYELSRWLVLNSSHPFRFAFIAAGGLLDWLAPPADFILAETHAQVSMRFAKFERRGRAGILPKLLLPGDFQESRDKTFDIINVGRFSRNKNQEALVLLFSRCRLALIGDGECYARIKSLAAAYPENVWLPGNVPRGQVPSLLARSRLMVHPSRGEGLPRVFVEAFACGVPVLAVRGAAPGAFEHGVHGLMVEQKDLVPTALALLEDEVCLREMGQRALEHARRNCTEEAVFEAVERMYDAVFRSERSRYYWRWTRQTVRVRAARQAISSRGVQLRRAFLRNRLVRRLGRRYWHRFQAVSRAVGARSRGHGRK